MFDDLDAQEQHYQAWVEDWLDRQGCEDCDDDDDEGADDDDAF